MSDLINRDDLGLVEREFSSHSLFSLALFGFHFRFLWARSRRAKMTGKRVAIIVLHHDNAWERRAVKGIVVSMMNAYSPEEPPLFDIYSAEGSLTRLNEEVMPIVEQNKKKYAAIITTGTWVSSHVRSYINERGGWLAPQLFVGVQDPVAAGLVKNFEIPQPGIIGVNSAPLDYTYCIGALKALVPGVKTVLLPHDAAVTAESFDAEKQRLIHHLKNEGIDVRLQPVDLTGDVIAQIEPHLASATALWTVEEPIIQMQAKKLSRLCAEHSVLFCANELASVFQGADVGWGDSGTLQGIYAGQICFALSIGYKTTQIKNIETLHPNTTRTNPGFFERTSVTITARTLVRDVIPLGWE